MKVLITGAGGQVGKALTAAAPKGVESRPVTHADLDITDAQAAIALIAREQPDLIVNAAAYTAVDKAESEPDRAREVNERGAANLAKAAAQTGARLIHVSTDFVFDGASSTPYAPDNEPHPLGVYGTTKLAGERAVLEHLGERALVLRTAWVYAAQGRNFLTTMLRLMRDKGTVNVVSDQIGTPTAASSIARAIWALSSKPNLSGIYHWTDSGVASWYDFAVAVAEGATELGLLRGPAEVIPIATEDYPTPARRPRFSVLDTRATVDALGILAPHWCANVRSVLGEIRLG
jgi:dTDP-4-dehydrorhamnose reductase